MNISKAEQRTLHAMARGGVIELERNESGKTTDAWCVTREGWRLADCTLRVFRKLKRKGLVASKNGRPYQITREGRGAVRPQLDNRA